ncbi:MAG: ubiquitin-like domain-containing protein [Nocardioides sp.]
MRTPIARVHRADVRNVLARPPVYAFAAVAVVATLVAVVSGLVVGQHRTTIILSLDGKTSEFRLVADTVEDALRAAGVDVGARDLVTPATDTMVADGAIISVWFAREFGLTVDGESKDYWVHATTVAGALAEIGEPYAGADLSASRSSTIGRSGLDLDVVTVKSVRVRAGRDPARQRTAALLTVRDALDDLGIDVDADDEVDPPLESVLTDGADIRVDRILVKRKVRREEFAFDTIRADDPGLPAGTTVVDRRGSPGTRAVTYRLTFRNGKLEGRRVMGSEVVRPPIGQRVRVGSKDVARSPDDEKPPRPDGPGDGDEPSEAEGPAGGGDPTGTTSVWDQLAQCESGGNWASDTGNGRYGGLQFDLGIWLGFGGTGLPHEHSRETQIAVATRVRDETRGYAVWSSCARQLGLPPF